MYCTGIVISRRRSSRQKQHQQHGLGKILRRWSWNHKACVMTQFRPTTTSGVGTSSNIVLLMFVVGIGTGDTLVKELCVLQNGG